MVNISITADATSTRKPTVPNRLALLENWVRYPITWRAMLSGTKLSTNQRCRPVWNWPNMGNAVNTESVTANSGTRAMVVVKVRLPAA